MTFWHWNVSRILLGIPILVMSIALIGLPLYVFPPQGTPSNADLIYILGPPTKQRVARAEELRREGISTRILVSVAQANSRIYTARQLPICSERDVTCEVPDPLKTRGEASMLSNFTKTHPVHNTAILTFAPQVMRARFIFAKCYKGEVSIVSVREPLGLQDWVFEYVYQTAGFLKATVMPCPK